jgi:hypothetical protein
VTLIAPISITPVAPDDLPIVQYYVKGEFHPEDHSYSYSHAPPPVQHEHEIGVDTITSEEPVHESRDFPEDELEAEKHSAQTRQEQENKEFSAPFTAWDPARYDIT